MTARWSFFVPGIPQSRGSKNAIPFRRGNGSLGVAVKDDNPKSKAWMALVALAAEKAMDGHPPLTGPARITFEFIMPRPLSHFGSGKNASTLKPSAPPRLHTQAPDALKLTRGTEDAMTGIVYRDDSQNSVGGWTKRWAEPGEAPGCRIEIEAIEETRRSGNAVADPRGDDEPLLF